MANRMARRTVDATTKRCTHGRAGDLGRWLTSALLVLVLVAPLPGMAAPLATQSLDAHSGYDLTGANDPQNL